jgi:hypothetical protein
MRLLLNEKMKKPPGCDLGTHKLDFGELHPVPNNLKSIAIQNQSPVCIMHCTLWTCLLLQDGDQHPKMGQSSCLLCTSRKAPSRWAMSHFTTITSGVSSIVLLVLLVLVEELWWWGCMASNCYLEMKKSALLPITLKYLFLTVILMCLTTCPACGFDHSDYCFCSGSLALRQCACGCMFFGVLAIQLSLGQQGGFKQALVLSVMRNSGWWILDGIGVPGNIFVLHGLNWVMIHQKMIQNPEGYQIHHWNIFIYLLMDIMMSALRSCVLALCSNNLQGRARS